MKDLSNVKIKYGITDSPFGKCIIATSYEGICYISFGKSFSELKKSLNKAPYKAIYKEERQNIAILSHKIFNNRGVKPFKVDLKGTKFQIKVWNALLKIPYGEIRTYSEVAKMIGKPTAVRAVANAIAKNNIAYLIPCHRVVPKSGGVGKYRWGEKLKKKLIESEKKLKTIFL